MAEQYRDRQGKAYDVDVKVKYLPFPNEEKRSEVYDTHAKLFLRAQENMSKAKLKKDGAAKEIARVSQIKESYKAIDEVMQEVILAEEESLSGMCALLDGENTKLNNPVIREVASILKQWNKIPATEIKTKVEAIKSPKL